LRIYQAQKKNDINDRIHVFCQRYCMIYMFDMTYKRRNDKQKK
jgi:hypothetical protein